MATTYYGIWCFANWNDFYLAIGYTPIIRIYIARFHWIYSALLCWLCTLLCTCLALRMVFSWNGQFPAQLFHSVLPMLKSRDCQNDMVWNYHKIQTLLYKYQIYSNKYILNKKNYTFLCNMIIQSRFHISNENSM